MCEQARTAADLEKEGDNNTMVFTMAQRCPIPPPRPVGGRANRAPPPDRGGVRPPPSNGADAASSSDRDQSSVCGVLNLRTSVVFDVKVLFIIFYE